MAKRMLIAASSFVLIFAFGCTTEPTDNTSETGDQAFSTSDQGICAFAGGTCLPYSSPHSACPGDDWVGLPCGDGVNYGCCLSATTTHPPPNACERAGGACASIHPYACANGKWGDANRFSCGGGLGVGCCLPDTPQHNECRAAGGVCTSPGPKNCVNGQWATQYSCGGGVLDGSCCMPHGVHIH